jgi:tetratricopeptide (TPR) repeat protein
MNNVDLFIKYLSGELNREEIDSFEKELASNLEFKEEFDQVSAAYELIRDQLQLRDEDEFRIRLLEVMKHTAKSKPPKGRRLRRGWYILLPLAACVAILLVIFLSPRSDKLLFSRQYHPENDKVLLAYMHGTRGKAETGILHYQQENYLESKKIMEELMAEDPENLLARLFFLLSSIETGNADQALEKLATLDPGQNHQLGQALTWYTALALLKTDRKEEALIHLHSLVLQEGPYKSDAIRLEKILLK